MLPTTSGAIYLPTMSGASCLPRSGAQLLASTKWCQLLTDSELCQFLAHKPWCQLLTNKKWCQLPRRPVSLPRQPLLHIYKTVLQSSGMQRRADWYCTAPDVLLCALHRRISPQGDTALCSLVAALLALWEG
jgi:hypothetical protein